MNEPTQRYQLALEIGEEAIRRGKWQQALTCFQTALTGLPSEPRVYNGLGDTHMALEDHTRALACYKEAARLDTNTPTYIDKVAAVQEAQGAMDDAAVSRLAAGDAYWKQGHSEAAEAQWQAAVQLQGDLLAAYERLAMAGKRRGDREATARHYLALAERLRLNNRCLMALHVCYTALVECPECADAWPPTEAAWRCVAARDRRGGRTEARIESGDLVNAGLNFAQWQLAAIIHQNTLSAGGNAGPEAYIHLRQAILSEGQGHAGAAIASYEKAIAAGIAAPAAFFVMGLLYRLVGRRPDAQAALLLAAQHPLYERVIALLE